MLGQGSTRPTIIYSLEMMLSVPHAVKVKKDAVHVEEATGWVLGLVCIDT